MPDFRNPDADPTAGDSAFASVDLNRTPLAGSPFAPDPTNPNLDDGQVLYHLAFGARPEDFHPSVQPTAQGYSWLFQPRPALGPGLLGSREDIRRAIAAAPNGSVPAAAPTEATRPALPTSYPKTLDPTVERHVTEYNQAQGLQPGDREYLDPDVIRAMIRQEAGHDMDALIRDPMQVNAFTGDWDNQKAAYGLTKGVPPGPDLSVKAGIRWLRRKAYPHDAQGRESRFIGWPRAVQRYNGRLPDYSDQVWDHLGEIKGGF